MNQSHQLRGQLGELEDFARMAIQAFMNADAAELIASLEHAAEIAAAVANQVRKENQ